MPLLNTLTGLIGRGRGSPEEQAIQGQAAIDAYEAGEHARWGRYLLEKERELMEAADAELARQFPAAPPLAEETEEPVS